MTKPKTNKFVPCSSFGIGDAVLSKDGIGVIVEAKCTYSFPGKPGFCTASQELKWCDPKPVDVDKPGHTLRVRYGLEFPGGGQCWWFQECALKLHGRGWLWQKLFPESQEEVVS
jgi:hypothetical protein